MLHIQLITILNFFFSFQVSADILFNLLSSYCVFEDKYEYNTRSLYESLAVRYTIFIIWKQLQNLIKNM